MTMTANYLPGETWSCECSEEYGPCEDHGTAVVIREGASTRTADDLLLLFCEDAAAVLFEETGEDRMTPWARTVMADAETLLMENNHYGCRWFPEEGDHMRDALVTLSDELSAELSTLDRAHFTYWEDGYVIYALADDCPLLAY